MALGGIHGASLTANQMPSATPVQDVFPRFDQRGTEIDGTVRSGSGMGLQLGANPFGEAWNASARLGDVRLATGTYAPFEVDLSFPAEVPWVIGRTYNARQDDGGHHDSDGYQGRNWFQTSQPELVVYDDVEETDDDILYLVYGADRFAEYEKEEGGGGDEYAGVNGASGVIEFVAGAGDEPDTWVLHDPSGLIVTFFAEDVVSGSTYSVDGQLWKIEDQAGNVAYVGHATTASTAATSGYTTDGRITTAYDSAGRRFTYTYTTLDSVDRLTLVKAEINTGSWVEVGRVDYDYYQTGAVTYGDIGCLKLATVVLPLSSTATPGTESQSEVRKTYYRYWTGTFDNSTNPGHPYALQYVVDAEGTRRFDWSDLDFDEDFLTATETALKPYAAASFEYDSSRRIDEVWFSGECGCGTGNDGVHALSYDDATGYATEIGNTTYSASPMQRTLVNRPDTAWITQTFDETGQVLTRVLTDDAAPTGSPTTTWLHGATRNSDGQVSVLYSPASGSSYTHSTWSEGYSTSTGVVRYYTYDSSSPYVTDIDWSQGYQAAAANRSRAEERDYSTVSETIGDLSVTRPYLSYRYAYPDVVAATTGDIADTGKTGSTAESGTGPDLLPPIITRTLPAVPTAENGSGTGNTTIVYRRDDGRPAFMKDLDGHYTYTRFDGNGQLVERIADADLTATYATGDDPNTDWGITEVSGGLAVSTTYVYDDQGRMETTTMPDGRVMLSYYTRLADGRLVTLRVPKYEDLATDVFHGPVAYSVVNLAGRAEATGVLAFSGGSTTTAISGWIDTADDHPVQAVSAGTLSRLSMMDHNDSGTRLDATRAYFLVPTGSPWDGVDGTHYDRTTYAYDDLGRRIRSEDPTGTVSRVDYDVRGNVTAVSVGTDDTGAAGGDSGGTNNMVTTEAREYDGNATGFGDDNRLTEITRYVQGSSTDERVTSLIHDARGRVIVVENPQSPHSVTAYDERGRVTATAAYSSASGLTAASVPTGTTNRLSYATIAYDRLDRAYDTRTYQIEQTGGSAGQIATGNICVRELTWYNQMGQVIKAIAATIQKTEYDRLHRPIVRWTIAEIDDTEYDDAFDADGDVVVEESRTVYDDDTGLVLATGTIQRNHDQTGTGALDSNADADPLKWTAANITGRIQIASMWYDGLNRLTTTALYGSNGIGNASDFDRDGLGVPSRSDTVLVTTRVYNDDGTLLSVTDPKALETRHLYDAAHRQTAVISNYVNGTPSGDTGADDNFVRYTYADGLMTEMWVDVDGDGTQDSDDQVTEYSYGVTTGGGSLVNSNRLLASTAYPDSASGTDVVAHEYNAQGQRISTTDQIGDELVFTYDTSGRQTSSAATLAMGSPTDNAILRIETAYDSRGLVSTVTSYDAASSGTVQNQVEFSYDNWGNVTLIEQDRDSVVGGSGTSAYEVGFAYEEEGSTGVSGAYRRVRRTTIDYPTGHELSFYYGDNSDTLGSSSRTNHGLSRVETVRIKPSGGSNVTEATYDYLGLGHVVRTDLPVPEMWSAVAGSSSTYPGLDRFNRIVESSWTWDYTTGTDHNAYEVDLSYDRNSNITLALDQWHNGRDVLYAMDDLNRLTGAQRGDESSGSITLENFHQEWTLDQTGNWDLFKNDLNGDNAWGGANEVNDTRVHNEANEIETRNTDSTGGVEHTLVYTAAGQLADDDQHYEYVYDAWGRLVEIEDQSSNTVTQYEYNGLGHRIGHRWDTDGNTSLEWQWLAYDDKWRVVARYEDGAAVTEPFEQLYHHAAGLAGYGGSSYIDLVICRDRDTDTESGGFESREYVLQNWRADVIALAAPDGDLLERITYDAYGIPFGTHPTDLTLGAIGGVAGYGMPDGTLNNDDYNYYLILYAASNWRADWDRDGDIDAADNTAYTNDKNAASGSWGRGVLSNRGGILGYAGYVHEPATGAAGGGHGTIWHVYFRVHHAGTGRWLTRDPNLNQEFHGTYEYCLSSPAGYIDPTGLQPRRSEDDPRSYPPREEWGPGWEGPGSRGNCWRYATCRPVDPVRWPTDRDPPFIRQPTRRQVRDHQILPGNLVPITNARSCFETVVQTLTDPCVQSQPALGECPPGSWQIAVLAGDRGDTHYLRQEPDGTWTHKRGNGPVLTTDCGDPATTITHPRDSDWRCRTNRHGGEDYQYCALLCASVCE